MYPNISIFSINISTYSLISIAAILLCGFLICKKGIKYNIDDNDMIVFLLFVGLGIVIGGHILYAITNMDKIIILFKHFDKITSFKMLKDSLGVIFGGQVFYGGLIGGIVSGLIYLKVTKKEYPLYTYIVAPFIALFHFFGRIGCFLVGCCYGVHMEGGVVFKHSLIESANNVPRFPVQLVEAFCNLILFIVLYYFQRKEKFKNTLLYIYLASYSVIRFILEFFRGDKYRGFVGPLSTSQLLFIS